MEKIVFLAHTETDKTLSKTTLEALTAATELAERLGAELTIGVVGSEVQDAADTLASTKAQFLAVQGAEFAESRYATDLLAAEALCREAEGTLIIAPQTSRWARCLGGLAARLNGRIETHVQQIEVQGGALGVVRWFYRQRMQGTVTRTRRPWILLVEAGSHNPWSGDAGNADLRTLSIDVPPRCIETSVSGIREPKPGEQTIRPDAELLFVAGAGWTKKQADGEVHIGTAAELIQGFVRTAQASLGSSKSLVDMEGEGQTTLPFLSHLNQVGQTGSTPRHPKGLATCCHGEEPHVVGWRFVNDRRAVNLDANCGWAQGKADVLYVADAFEVMEKLNQRLSSD